MKNRFEAIYDTALIIVSAIIMISLSVATRSEALAPVIQLINSSDSYVFAGEYISNLLSERKADEEIVSDNRTVYAENPLTSLTETPPDILQLIKSAKDSAANDIKDGAITERQYGKSNITTSVGNILVRNNTDTQKNIDLGQYFDATPQITVKDKRDPAVLIFHTHTTESYELLDRDWYAQDYITRSNSSDRNMVRVGMEIKEQLENAGYGVIHDTQIHDHKYTGAYAHSRESVERILKENPSIQIVLDVHRDAIEQSNGERIKPIATVLGKKAAQIMIITGCEEGNVTDFPNWEKNLTFALELQSVCENLYPGLMRPIYFCQRKYNMDLTHNNLLVEMGSCANTLEEAAYSGKLLGNALVKLLDSAKE